MMKPLTGRTFGKRLCELLDLNPARVYEIDIRMRVNSLTEINVKQYMDEIEGDMLLWELKRYQIVEVEEEENNDGRNP